MKASLVQAPSVTATDVSRASYGALDLLARRVVFSLLARIRRGGFTLIDDGGVFPVGAPRTNAPCLRVEDPSVYRAVLLGGSVGAGEAYVEGRWSTDDLPGLLGVLAQNLSVLDALDAGPFRLGRDAVARFARRNTRAGSRRNIAAHYDVSNDFFRVFLDPSMTYSSAVFPRDDAGLEEAQVTKIDRVCRKLDLRPGEHLLEIGTGWGALALHAARAYGCRVTTTTVSREQHALATERVRSAGLGDRVRVLFADYRDLEGTFDKLVSVEMIEAVGHEHLGAFFRVAGDRLTDEGAMLLQAITIEDRRYDRHRREVDFIKKHIFPGSTIPSVTAMLRAAARTCDLRLGDLEDITPHYARTLRHWRETLLAGADVVLRSGRDPRFLRTWEYYLAYCEAGFAEGYLGSVQMLFHKPRARAARTLRERT